MQNRDYCKNHNSDALLLGIFMGWAGARLRMMCGLATTKSVLFCAISFLALFEIFFSIVPSGSAQEPTNTQAENSMSIMAEAELRKVHAAIERDEDGNVVEISMGGNKIMDETLSYLKA